MRTMESLRLDDTIEDILITLGKQLALARHNFRRIEADLTV